MSYPYGLKLGPASGNGLPGLPKRMQLIRKSYRMPRAPADYSYTQMAARDIIYSTEFSPDGRRVFFSTNLLIAWHTLAVPFDLSTAGPESTYAHINTGDWLDDPKTIAFSPDGMRLYANHSDGVGQAALTVPFDPSTRGAFTYFIWTAKTTRGYCFRISSDGKYLYVGDPIGGGNTSLDFYQYQLTTPWDVTTAVFVASKLAVPSRSNYAFHVSGDGNTLYVSAAAYGSTGTAMFAYTMATPYMISTITNPVIVIPMVNSPICFSINEANLRDGKYALLWIENDNNVAYSEMRNAEVIA